MAAHFKCSEHIENHIAELHISFIENIELCSEYLVFGSRGSDINLKEYYTRLLVFGLVAMSYTLKTIHCKYLLESTSCTSRRELSNEASIANFGVDTSPLKFQVEIWPACLPRIPGSNTQPGRSRRGS